MSAPPPAPPSVAPAPDQPSSPARAPTAPPLPAPHPADAFDKTVTVSSCALAVGVDELAKYGVGEERNGALEIGVDDEVVEVPVVEVEVVVPRYAP